MNDAILSGFCFFLVALLYSTVGHAGASGYLASMALLAFPPAVMKPTALALNIVVALVASARFYKAGYFSWRLFWPFALASVPMAYLGGGFTIDTRIYKILVGMSLLFAAGYFFIHHRSADDDAANIRLPGIPVALVIGGLIGLVSGLTGVGGGIFLSPVLLMAHWARFRQTAAVAAVFILANSVSGLLGHLHQGGGIAANLPIWAIAVLAGGFIGASLGATRLNNPVLRLLMGLVLVIAGMKLVVGQH